MPESPLCLYKSHPVVARLLEILDEESPARCFLRTLAGSSLSMCAAAVIHKRLNANLFILSDKEEAAYFMNDLENLCGRHKLLFFPSSRRPSLTGKSTDAAGMIQRTEVLRHLSGEGGKSAIVTYPEALFEKVIPKTSLEQVSTELKKGEAVSRSFLTELLLEYGFRETDFVYEPGEFAVRGSIIDVFSFSDDRPCRIDFFGDTVETIRYFDIETQLSEKRTDSVSIVPDTGIGRQLTGQTGSTCNLLSLFDDTALVWIKDTELVLAGISELFDAADPSAYNEDLAGEGVDKEMFFSGRDETERELMRFSLIESGQSPFFGSARTIGFNTSPQPAFRKNFELLAQTLADNSEKGYTNYIFSENQKQFERLGEIFNEIYGTVTFTPVLSGLYRGFADHDLQICCYTDHQVFERHHRYRIKEDFKRKESVTLKTLQDLKPGDYVVHIDHGIGKFGGLEKIEVNGRLQETLKLVYKDNDTLYVSIHSLHRISRYKGKEGIPPKINKLGTGAWQKVKERTKGKVKEMARELINLYARRKMEKGFRFSPDSYLQKELEASFIYEDTPDQLKATNMVKEQMESSMPMDMLVCGDVGFGKTEVAIRAAFKAVTDSKQVALLVPTTILAMQHYNTFLERLKEFPCSVEHLSRFRSARKQKEIIGRLAEGKIDVLIGTHRIIGKDVKFRDLGLLIIDEEQKFGVAIKERLKNLKFSVDTLTLTATPIPRTLQFSLSGARDLAIINTPPPNRHPIETRLVRFDTETIKDAVEFETRRGGQVFFIHNRVRNIADIEEIITRSCPGIRVVSAHGQMESSRLENIMLGFISGKYDVLVSTTIIESGLDIPNANTIIINNAHQFGLSDLHQLRGRVGRSNKKAYCYMLVPPPQSMTRDARQRLRAIEEFSGLGSGFNIAMQDLDIRGAGNLLGREQSGFIADIGFETYHKILDEAVRELRETEFSELFSRQETRPAGTARFVSDCQIDTDLELLLPEEYIPGNSERIRLYRMLDSAEDEESLSGFVSDLVDRFGPPPKQSRELFDIVRLRHIAVRLGFEKISIRNGKMVIFFISNQESHYYRSELFRDILGAIQKQQHFRLSERNNKLTMTVNDVGSVKRALDLLGRFETEVGGSAG
ncbi:MAG: transcription-repair coupling factor [Marinilabiliales bacterium]|nr:MAG: transcription-repair coupling factor [Marinilabiliales bacterium]